MESQQRMGTWAH